MSKSTEMPGLALGDQVLEALVGLLRRAEAGDLAHRPGARAVHRRVRARGCRGSGRAARRPPSRCRRRARGRRRGRPSLRAPVRKRSLDSPRRSRNAASSPASQLSSSSATRRRSSSGASGVVGTVLMRGLLRRATRIRLRPAVRGSMRRCCDVVDGALERVAGRRATRAPPSAGPGRRRRCARRRRGARGAPARRARRSHARCASRASASSGDARAVAGDGARGSAAPSRSSGTQAEHVAQLGDRAVRLRAVGLVDDVQVGDLEQARP